MRIWSISTAKCRRDERSGRADGNRAEPRMTTTARRRRRQPQTATFPFLNKLFGAAGSDGGNTPAQRDAANEDRADAARGDKPNGQKNKKHKFLDTYCRNLTRHGARTESSTTSSGVTWKLERVIQILNRRQKNNPCLIGEPGVGKTAIAEALASRIAAGDVPYKLRGQGGLSGRHDRSCRGNAVPRAVRKPHARASSARCARLGNVDSCHRRGAQSSSARAMRRDSMNAANILKPALSRGEIQVIGATTLRTNTASISKRTPRWSAASSRSRSTSRPWTRRWKFCRASRITTRSSTASRFRPEIARQAVVLSERYITDRFLPDKAIDLLDEACSDAEPAQQDTSA